MMADEEIMQITKLSSNENPFGPSPKAVDAAKLAIASANRYPERTDKKLCDALAAFHGRGLTSAQFFSANSGVEVLSLVEDALIKPGQRAIICPPCFSEYSKSLANKGCEIDRVPLIGSDFRLDVDAILRRINKDTRLLYLCNPNNPTGTWFGESVLGTVLGKIPDDVTVIYDEVYYQFATEEGLPDAIRHVLDDQNVVIVHSFSKAYGLAGMRIGYGIAPQRIAQSVKKRKRNFHLSAAGMDAAIAALGDRVHLQRTVDNNHAERLRLATGLKALNLEVTPSQANFLMVRCPKGFNAEELAGLLVGNGVMVRPAFDLPHCIRITVGAPGDNTRLLALLDTLLEG
ncbi:MULTISPECIES: pyridoxal phosphate-dependent aminotransferase [Cupriavidus]|uniref:Aminotransferase n=5 Tax=Cupriavidus TaxID=106589 RepID=A0A375CMC9_9BURK|nr:MULTISPECIES: histidinol-phosphate transaminase [Cupriavidus]MCO4893500.1 aminotransferase class I/II-fold pyridoxal phosphate-dependent enzyme [Cupriavidus sp. WGtm5]ULX55868.1 histidinol phosphate aminotransferase [Cupriavidus taiwanensis]CAP64050.1 putative Histidinol-phosphate aminotransferase 1 (Imidazole acetol-phosphate transaminase 1) [Cupriavidus taiwanensis LMG 19424]SOY75169.1 putative Histidinol-phosphate aminotransferase 1 (Imidazole acetol-phosphate transaminase 1) [Cupriavidus